MQNTTSTPQTPQNGSQAVILAITKILVERGRAVRAEENEKPTADARQAFQHRKAGNR